MQSKPNFFLMNFLSWFCLRQPIVQIFSCAIFAPVFFTIFQILLPASESGGHLSGVHWCRTDCPDKVWWTGSCVTWAGDEGNCVYVGSFGKNSWCKVGRLVGGSVFSLKIWNEKLEEWENYKEVEEWRIDEYVPLVPEDSVQAC